MQTKTQSTALVTGASAGIGLELAKLFSQDGYNLVLVARSVDKLDALAKELGERVKVLVLAVDLSKPDGPEKVFAATQHAHIEVDILVNNAGFGQFGDYDTLPLKDELEQIQLNITSLTHLTKLYCAGMVSRRRGRILNVASTAAFQAGPLMSVYYATKAYVLSYTVGIANELRPKGVFVTCLCPGPTKTEFQKRASLSDSALLNMSYMDAKTVAEQGYRALMNGKALKVNGFFNALLALSPRLLPHTWTAAIARRLQERRKA